jgi:hypothetical protein
LEAYWKFCKGREEGEGDKKGRRAEGEGRRGTSEGGKMEGKWGKEGREEGREGKLLPVYFPVLTTLKTIPSTSLSPSPPSFVPPSTAVVVVVVVVLEISFLGSTLSPKLSKTPTSSRMLER